MSEGSRAVVSTGGAEERIGGVLVRTLLDTGAGRDGLVRRRVEVLPGSRAQAVAGPGGGLWYVVAGQGVMTSGTTPDMAIRRDIALWLPPATRAAALRGDHRAEHAAGARRLPPRRQPRRQGQRVLSARGPV